MCVCVRACMRVCVCVCAYQGSRGEGGGAVVNGKDSVAMVTQTSVGPLTLARMFSVIFVSVNWSNLAPVLHGQERNIHFTSGS